MYQRIVLIVDFMGINNKRVIAYGICASVFKSKNQRNKKARHNHDASENDALN